MSDFTFTIAVRITAQQIMDNLDAAFYSGIHYWGRIVDAKLASNEAERINVKADENGYKRVPDAAYPWACAHDGSVTIFEADSEVEPVLSFRRCDATEIDDDQYATLHDFCAAHGLDKETTLVSLLEGTDNEEEICVQGAGGISYMVSSFGKGHLRVLDRAAIEKGLAWLVENHPSHFVDILQDKGDRTTGDCLVQAALFQEFVYG